MTSRSILYAVAIKKLPEDRQRELMVLIVPLDGSKVVEIPLCQFTAKKENDAAPLLSQLAIAPDRRTIAVASTFLEGLQQADRTLYVVEFTDTDHKLIKVPAPAPVEPTGSGK